MPPRPKLVIFGFGALGASVAHAALRSLRREDVMIVDQDGVKLQVARRNGYGTVRGNATCAQIQIDAGAASTRNIVICMTESRGFRVLQMARSLNSKAEIRIAAETTEAGKRFIAAGADYVLLIPTLTGEMLAAAALS